VGFLNLFIFWSFQEVAKRFAEFAKSGHGAVRLAGDGEQSSAELEEKEKAKARGAKWRQGDMEFEAYMRMLDNSVRSSVSLYLLFFFVFFRDFKFQIIPNAGLSNWLSLSYPFGKTRDAQAKTRC